MSPALLFDFSANKDNNTINITREFAADLHLVWAAWTQAGLIDQWWAPKPYQTITKSMDFSVGGFWLYAMQGPDGTLHWCRADYKAIEPFNSFSGLDAFCDENGQINTQFPRSLWANTFKTKGQNTEVSIVITYEKLADLEKIIELGFKEGFTAALGNLDQYLEAQLKLRSHLQTAQSSRVCTYLNFPGNTEEAFLFYQSVFNTPFNGGIQRFGDLPAAPGQAPIDETVKNMILHIELPIIGQHVLMGTDAPKEMGFTVVQGNNMHISLEPESREEADRIFDALSAGGTITMPMQEMFWGAYFGSFSDKFGINWMVNYLSKNN